MAFNGVILVLSTREGMLTTVDRVLTNCRISFILLKQTLTIGE